MSRTSYITYSWEYLKGSYNGSYMRAFKTFPVIQVSASNLSKKALKRLEWFDFYNSHGKNISLTCRHFGISRDTFYLWRKRFNPRYLQTLEFDTKTRSGHATYEVETQEISSTPSGCYSFTRLLQFN